MARADPLEAAGRRVDRDRLADICRRFGVAELAVFGSEARGTATETSDVDLLYVLAPEARLGFAFVALEDELTALFGCPPHLVARRVLHDSIRERVLAEARLLYP